MLALGALSFAEIAGAGAQRVSVGGSLAWAGVTAFAAAAEAIRDHGDFSGLGSGAQWPGSWAEPALSARHPRSAARADAAGRRGPALRSRSTRRLVFAASRR